MLQHEPTTHKKILRTVTVNNDTVTLYEIGVRYHHNTYTPELAYFVSLNGRGKKFDGTDKMKAYMRASDCFEATAEELGAEWRKQETTPPATDPTPATTDPQPGTDPEDEQLSLF